MVTEQGMFGDLGLKDPNVRKAEPSEKKDEAKKGVIREDVE